MLCFTPFCDSLEKLHDRDSDFLIGAAYCLLPEPISTTEWHFFHATRKWKRKESVLKNAPTSTPADYNLCSLYFPVNFYCLMLAPAERNTWAQSLRSPTSPFPFWSNKDYMGRHANIQKKSTVFLVLNRAGSRCEFSQVIPCHMAMLNIQNIFQNV